MKICHCQVLVRISDSSLQVLLQGWFVDPVTDSHYFVHRYEEMRKSAEKVEMRLP